MALPVNTEDLQKDINKLSPEHKKRVQDYIEALGKIADDGDELLDTVCGSGSREGLGDIRDGIKDAKDHIRYVQNGFIAVGCVVGGVGGAIAGAYAGACFGPVGIAVGAIAGGIAGLIAGGFLGSALASLLLYVIDKIKSVRIMIKTKFGCVDINSTMRSGMAN